MNYTNQAPIDYVQFSERYNRYHMAEYGMTKIQPGMGWTKPDLISACRCYKLKTTGNKTVLLGRLQQGLA